DSETKVRLLIESSSDSQKLICFSFYCVSVEKHKNAL
ncbi:MAG: hypothetical protein ACI9T7_003815, partial [Oleiphilaceae bacterium]